MALSMSGQSARQFKFCSCFLTDNYFVAELELHLKLPPAAEGQQISNPDVEEQVIQALHQRHWGPDDDPTALQRQLSRMRTAGTISRCVDELLTERRRRESEDEASSAREAAISQQYTFLSPDIFRLGAVSEPQMLDARFVSIVEALRQAQRQELSTSASFDQLRKFGLTPVMQDVFSLPVFTESFCTALLSELANFSRKSPVSTGRPNTMNRGGLLLDELAPVRAWLDQLRSDWLQPLVDFLLPEAAGGAELDSHRAFTVLYTPGGDTSLGYHYDNSEATLNVCLTDSSGYHGNELYFGDLVEPRPGGCPMASQERLAGLPSAEQRLGWGLLHPGRRMHGVRPLQSGCRQNLILWLRASRARSQLCPRCWRKPQRPRPSRRYGDGMT